jgi:hypothetical protein
MNGQLITFSYWKFPTSNSIQPQISPRIFQTLSLTISIKLMTILHEYSLLSRPFEFVQFQESPEIQMCGGYRTIVWGKCEWFIVASEVE